MKIAIIGAGAAGIIAALQAIGEKTEVDLYEKNNAFGKKILVSGNGRCNITNINLKTDNFTGEDTTFVEYLFKEFGFWEFKKYCEKMGLFLKIKENGKVYPLSNEAKSVLKIFEINLKEKGVNILLSKPVKFIKKTDNKFYVYTEDGSEKKYDRVLLCNGSKAAPKIGGNDSGYKMAKTLGHNVNMIYPCLVQLETVSKNCAKIAGVKIDSEVSLKVNCQKYIKVRGDILFTKYGLSGFAILDISSYVSKLLLKQKRVNIFINLLPNYDKSELLSIFENIKKFHNRYDILTMLSGLISLKIAKVILNELKINQNKMLKETSAKEMRVVADKILDWHFEINSTHGFEYAEVCGGGLRISQINPKTMESKILKGLFFAGEILDITGKRGGFNLAFAWSSGYIAGKNIGKLS